MDLHGYPVHRVLVEQAADIASEYYLGVTVDRASQSIVIILSAAGGVDIEEIAATDPDKIAKITVDAGLGLRDFHIRQLMAKGGVPAEQVRPMSAMIRTMFRIAKARDAQLVEINPCAALADGSIVALDGKVEIDENAHFRQMDLVEQEVPEADHPLEREAEEKGLAYVKLEGEVGIIGNGAGLVMTT